MTNTRNGSPNWVIHPGEILKEEFLKPMGLSSYALAKSLHVPVPRVHDIVLQKRGITPDTAVRLAKFFETSEQFWLNLQAAYDVSKIKKEQRKALKAIQPMVHHTNAG